MSGCAVMEQSVEEVTERPLPATPVIATCSDSTKVFNAKSAIQRSPEYILSSFVVVKDGKFCLEISKEEREELGISEKAYNAYLKQLTKVNLTR